MRFVYNNVVFCYNRLRIQCAIQQHVMVRDNYIRIRCFFLCLLVVFLIFCRRCGNWQCKGLHIDKIRDLIGVFIFYQVDVAAHAVNIFYKISYPCFCLFVLFVLLYEFFDFRYRYIIVPTFEQCDFYICKCFFSCYVFVEFLYHLFLQILLWRCYRNPFTCAFLSVFNNHCRCGQK